MKTIYQITPENNSTVLLKNRKVKTGFLRYLKSKGINFKYNFYFDNNY